MWGLSRGRVDKPGSQQDGGIRQHPFQQDSAEQSTEKATSLLDAETVELTEQEADVSEGESPPLPDGASDRAADSQIYGPVPTGSIAPIPQPDLTLSVSVPSGFVCGANCPSTRGTTPADSWSGGARPGGEGEPRPSLWVAVADGIGDRQGSAGAAAVAVETVNRFLAATTVTVDSLFAAFHSASLAVDAYVAGLSDAGMHSRDVGGTTLTLGALTGNQVVCLWAGDTPAWAINAAGVHRLTPPHQRGPLRDWLGAGDIVPTLRTMDRSEAGGILVGSDGLEPAMEDPDHVASVFNNAPHTLATRLVTRSQRRGVSDDITAAVAVDVPSPSHQELHGGDSDDTRPIPVMPPATPEPVKAQSEPRAAKGADQARLGPDIHPNSYGDVNALDGERVNGPGVQGSWDEDLR